MEFIVTLYRDSLQTPWGFRLEGGRDFKAPLTVSRVFAGSPAASDLMRGDIITSIHNEDATYLFHQEANDIIRTSGGNLQLGIKRIFDENEHHHKALFQPFQTYATRGFKPINNPLSNSVYSVFDDEDTYSRYRNRAIEKNKDPKPVLSQTGSPFLPNYQPFTVGECSSVQRYTTAKTQPIHSNLVLSKPSYPKFNNTNNTPMPYHDRRMIGHIQQNLTRAVHAPHVNLPSPLKGPNLPKNTMQIGQYQIKTNIHEDLFNVNKDNFTPKIVNLQYNSPIGLYSNSSLKQEVNKRVRSADCSLSQPSSEF